MVGGSPIFMPSMPTQQRPATQPQPLAQQASAGSYVPPRLTPPAKTAVAQPPAPRVARGVPREEPTPPRPLAIPTPEELGIASPRQAQPLDWTVIRRQMSDLGVVRFDLQHLAGGKARFSCWLPGATAGDSPRLVQAEGEGELEAVRVCLDRARVQRTRKQ